MSTPDQTRDYYDRYADHYGRRTGFDSESGHRYNFRRYYEPLLDRAVPKTGRILELGCGTGFYTRWLADRGLEVVAMDISSGMIERARRRCPESISFQVGNCEDPASVLTDTGDGFDAIGGINTFSYYANKRDALGSYGDLLREGGKLILLDMNGTSFTQRIAYLTNFREARRFLRNVDESVPKTLADMLETRGFAVESLVRFAFVPNNVGRLGVALLGPVDRLLARAGIFDGFAIRLFLVARKA